MFNYLIFFAFCSERGETLQYVPGSKRMHREDCLGVNIKCKLIADGNVDILL